MKKRIAGLCMTLALVFGMSMGVYAADTPVATFDGSGQIKYNYDYNEDFGDAFEGMLPGDERTQQIILRNTSEKPTESPGGSVQSFRGGLYLFFNGYAGRGK